jgi:cytochrome c6
MAKYIIFLCLALAVFACGSKENGNTVKDSSSSKPAVDGAKIFKQNCELCHGADGKLGANGSKDLTVSELDMNERIARVTKGKGLMMPYENILSLAEIKAVVEYTMTLKKN